MNDIVLVLTSKSLETIFEEGGTGHWKANPARINHCKYVIVVRNAHSDWVQDDRPHSIAFMIGRGLKAVPSGDRYVIQVEEYAEIEIPNFWTGQRNPVAYLGREHLTDKLDLSQVVFQPFPHDKVVANEDLNILPLTIAEAKKGIAKKLDISPESIEIIIRT